MRCHNDECRHTADQQCDFEFIRVATHLVPAMINESANENMNFKNTIPIKKDVSAPFSLRIVPAFYIIAYPLFARGALWPPVIPEKNFYIVAVPLIAIFETSVSLLGIWVGLGSGPRWVVGFVWHCGPYVYFDFPLDYYGASVWRTLVYVC